MAGGKPRLHPRNSRSKHEHERLGSRRVFLSFAISISLFPQLVRWRPDTQVVTMGGGGGGGAKESAGPRTKRETVKFESPLKG